MVEQLVIAALFIGAIFYLAKGFKKSLSSEGSACAKNCGGACAKDFSTASLPEVPPKI